MEVISKELSNELKLKLEVVDGKVKSSLSYDGHQADVEMSVSLDIEAYAQQLKAAIKGPVDDLIIDALIAMLKAK